MTEDPENLVHAFSWSLVPRLSELLNGLGRHGFRTWPDSPEALRTELETLRIEPEQDIALLCSADQLCGWAITLPEPDIDRIVATIAVSAQCEGHSKRLLDFVFDRAKLEDVELVHVAAAGASSEPVAMLEHNGFRQAAVTVTLALGRHHAAGLNDSPLAEGFSLRKMRSTAEALALTQVQNAVFAGHWGFSKNTPEEVQARLDLPSTSPHHVLFAESANGDIAGYIWTALEWDGEKTRGKVWMTGVIPDYRGTGIGGALVVAGIKHLFADGAAVVDLEVVEDNAAARRIYERLGFEETGRTVWYEKRL